MVKSEALIGPALPGVNERPLYSARLFVSTAFERWLATRKVSGGDMKTASKKAKLRKQIPLIQITQVL